MFWGEGVCKNCIYEEVWYKKYHFLESVSTLLTGIVIGLHVFLVAVRWGSIKIFFLLVFLCQSHFILRIKEWVMSGKRFEQKPSFHKYHHAQLIEWEKNWCRPRVAARSFVYFMLTIVTVAGFLRAVKMNKVLHSDLVQAPELSLVSSAQKISLQLHEMCLTLVIIINNYSPKARWSLVNIHQAKPRSFGFWNNASELGFRWLR